MLVKIALCGTEWPATGTRSGGRVIRNRGIKYFLFFFQRTILNADGVYKF